MRTIIIEKRSNEERASMTKRVGALALFFIAVVSLLLDSGCGLETEKANAIMAEAEKHQVAAEEILARIKNFPADWEAIFNVSRIGQNEIFRARELIEARKQDIEMLDVELRAWGKKIHEILSLNVDEKIKEYVRLKMNAINLYDDYLSNYVGPILKSYVGILELLQAGRPITQLNSQAEEIRRMVEDSKGKLEECLNAEKQAEQYFKTNKLGKEI